jgi:hypothetical protein
MIDLWMYLCESATGRKALSVIRLGSIGVLEPDLYHHNESCIECNFAMAVGTSVMCDSVFGDNDRLRLGKFFDYL